MQAQVPPRVHRVVIGLGLAGAAALGLSLWALAADRPLPDLALVGWSGAFLALFLLLERSAVTFAWRDHRFRVSLTEVAVLLGFVWIPAPLVVVLMAVGLAGVQLAARRPPVKAAFNIAKGVIAGAAGAALMVAFPAAGVARAAMAVVGTALYSVLNELQVALVLALMEDVPAMRIYRERFLGPNSLALMAGVPTAIAFLSLWTYHPVAILALVPLGILVHRHAKLQAEVDRELAVRRRLAEDSFGLIGIVDREAVATTILASCHDLLDAGRVELELAGGERWGEDFEPADTARDPITAPIFGKDGAPLGQLTVWARPLKPAFGEEERALLGVVATMAAHAFESAAATEQLAAQRDVLARQEKLSTLGTLMAGVAHEINNPLTYMRLRLAAAKVETQRAQARADAAPEARAYAESMAKTVDTFERGVQRLTTLCGSLKSVAKPGDGARHPTDLNEVVREVVTVVRAAHKTFEWKVDLGELPRVEANAAEMHQVALNLLKNAAEALEGREDARIEVRTARDERGIAFVVEDNGPGIPPEMQRRLFTAFATSKAGGTGLGLSISQQIVRAHGGEIECRSEPGAGTRFTVRLPALVAPVAA